MRRSARARRIVRNAAGRYAARIIKPVHMSSEIPPDDRVDAAITDYLRLARTPSPRDKSAKAAWQRTVHANVQQRQLLVAQMRHDDDARRAELDRCRADIVHWMASWCWTLDPRPEMDGDDVVGPSMLPFLPWDDQVGYLHFLDGLERQQQHGVAEKSRDVGLTWLTIAWMTHRWLFREQVWKGGVGSRVEDLVDQLDQPDSVMEKMRILLRYLPSWMLPVGYSEKLHARRMKITNPITGSSVVGEAGRNIGRGGRNSFYMVDENAFLDDPESADRALSQNAPAIVYISTPNGMGNTFFQKRHSGHYPVYTLHWRSDPRKDEAWYRAQCQRFSHDPVTIAQELDIDYTASREGVTIPAAWVTAAINHDLGDGGGGTLVRAGGDVGAGGKKTTAYVLRIGSRVTLVETLTEKNTTTTAHWFDALCRRHGVREFAYDAAVVGIGVGSALKKIGDGTVTELKTITGECWTSTALPYIVIPVQSGAPAGDEVWPDGRTSKERFANVRAVIWWTLRERFERTYEHVNGLAVHPPEDRISIPDDRQLCQELSTPGYERTETGKIRVESKEKMAKRGVKSPNKADALAYAFYAPARSGWHDMVMEAMTSEAK